MNPVLPIALFIALLAPTSQPSPADVVHGFLRAVRAGDVESALRFVDREAADQQFFRAWVEADVSGRRLVDEAQRLSGGEAEVRFRPAFGSFERARIDEVPGEPDRLVAFADDGARLACLRRTPDGGWLLSSQDRRDGENYPGKCERIFKIWLAKSRLLLRLIDAGAAGNARELDAWNKAVSALGPVRQSAADTEPRRRVDRALDPVLWGCPEMLEGRLKGSERGIKALLAATTAIQRVREQCERVDVTTEDGRRQLALLLSLLPRETRSLGRRFTTTDEDDRVVITSDSYRALEYDKRTGKVMFLDADYAVSTCFDGVAEAEALAKALNKAVQTQR